LAFFAMIVAPLIAYAPDGLFGYLQKVNGCYSIPILTIIVIGYFTKYVPALAAKIAMFSGVILYLAYILLDSFVLKDTFPHYLHVMAILFVFNAILMLIIGKIKPQLVPYEPYLTQMVSVRPWKFVVPIGITITVMVVGVYMYFSR